MAARNLITNSKLLFGCDFNSPYVKEVAPSCKAEVVDKDGKAGFFIPSLGRVVLPEEVSEEFLRVIYQKAVERIGNKPIGSVTITVPVKYSLLQRKLLRNAAVNAGITCPVHIITEPTAAAIAYGVENSCRNGKILIYDLGGGTFDVSIVQVRNGTYFEFINKDGDRSIGGSYFDKLIQNYLEQCFQKDHLEGKEIPLVPSFLISEYKAKYLRTLAELHNTCMDAKHEVCNFNISTEVDLTRYIKLLRIAQNLSTDEDEDEDDISLAFTYALTVEKFNEMIDPYIQQTISITKRCIENSNLTPNDISFIVLVGGSTRIPLVKTALQRAFPNCPLSEGVNKETCVSEGAARYTTSGIQDCHIQDCADMTICYLPGIRFKNIITAGTPLPAQGSHRIKLNQYNAGIISVRLYEYNPQTPDKKTFLHTVEYMDPSLHDSSHILKLSYCLDIESQLHLTISEGDKILVKDICQL